MASFRQLVGESWNTGTTPALSRLYGRDRPTNNQVPNTTGCVQIPNPLS